MSQIELETRPELLARAMSRRRLLGNTMSHLERVVAGHASAEGWLDRVEAGLADLREALDAHIDEVEGHDGLLADIVDVAPRLSPYTEELRREHIALLGAWLRAEAAVRAARQDWPAAVSTVRRRVITLIGRLTLHRQAGSDLVFEAYNVDIAASD
ncbi:MAG: hypothetical protein ACRDWS_01640 [Acidimicrobiia bacterium]